MRSIVQTSNAVRDNKWLAGARLIYDVVKAKRAALGLSTKPFSSWAGLDLDVQQIVAGLMRSLSQSYSWHISESVFVTVILCRHHHHHHHHHHHFHYYRHRVVMGGYV